MSKTKMIRDPIYGYITLEKDFSTLVDTAEFQRLRNIRQTGYQALYPSALHNRFVHSLGVFFLGGKAIGYFEKNISEMIPSELSENWEKIKRTFLAACLLHDVGHSPFSHTGEEYYNKGIDFSKALAKAVGVSPYVDDADYQPRGDDELRSYKFYKDMKSSRNGTGKPHESMSALIGLELCHELKVVIDDDLFVRAIIGAKYQTDVTPRQADKAILNAIVELLNGDLIDVDKLDYVSRDSYVTGYSSMTLDLDRLLSSYTVCNMGDGTYRTAYKKGALSVIENVIYANDLERRWIQNHPAILYDCQLVDILLRHYDKYMRGDVKGTATVFTKEALSQKGMPGLRQNLKLLCDDDIISYIKNENTTRIGEQFFSRNARLKPLWKTEATFEHLVGKSLTPELLGEITEDFRGMSDYIQNSGAFFINEDLLKTLTESLEQKQGAHGLESYSRILEMCQLFRAFTKEYRLEKFEYILIFTNKFQSAYKKVGIKETYVQLESGVVLLEEVLSVRAKEAAHDANKTLFYVYTAAENVQNDPNLGAKFIDFLRRNYRLAQSP